MELRVIRNGAGLCRNSLYTPGAIIYNTCLWYQTLKIALVIKNKESLNVVAPCFMLYILKSLTYISGRVQSDPDVSFGKAETAANNYSQALHGALIQSISVPLLISGGFFQQWLGEFHIEKLDQGPHEKGCDQGPDPGKQAAERTCDDTDQITSDAAEAKRLSALVGDDDRNGVIDRDAQIGCHVQGSGEAHSHYAHQQHQYADRKRGRRRKTADRGLGKIRNIACQEHIDKGSDTDIVLIQEEIQDQHEKT